MAGHLRRSGSVLAALVALLIISFGCGDDDGSPIFDCPNCGNWEKVVDANASYPCYQPGSDGAVIAFNSNRGNAANIEHIWVLDRTDPESPEYHAITDGPNDDFDPMWSPGGDRLSFTRSIGEAYELYLIRVDDFANPGDEIRLTNTNVSDTVTISRPTYSSWLDENTILFTDGQNILTIELDGDEPAVVKKVVNDPSDYVLSGTDDFIENQPAGHRSASGDRFYFISDSRVPLGAIAVSAYDEESEEPLEAEIFLEGFPTGTTTPDTLGGRPEGGYMVGVGITDDEAEETYCDTVFRSLVNVFENMVTPLDFAFNNPRGRIILVAGPVYSKFYYDGMQTTSIQKDTTVIECVYPGVLHEVKIVSIDARDSTGAFLRDSAWVSIRDRQDTLITLDVSGRSGKSGQSLAGGSATIRPPRENRSETAGAGKAAQWIQTLWEYDTATGAHAVLSASGESPSHPAVDPTGEYLVYVVDKSSLKIVSLVNTNQTWRIPLPGATGVNICFRNVAHPAWSADGTRIIVSLTPCLDRPSSDNNASEYEIWEVRADRYLN